MATKRAQGLSIQGLQNEMGEDYPNYAHKKLTFIVPFSFKI